MASHSRVFTIPASAPFLPTLADALLDGRLIPGFAPRGNPLQLATATVYLPTRRAARAFENTILRALRSKAAILPRIVPLGDVDEDALAFADETREFSLPAAIEPSKRRLVLAQLVLKFAQTLSPAAGGRESSIATTPAAAIVLADQLVRLFDDMTIAGVKFETLDQEGIVPAEIDEYWQKSLEFLKIARKGWIDYLHEKDLADPTAHRDRLLTREAERLVESAGGPVIAAGSTGSIPAVARLIAAIAGRPNGAVVVPGIDLDLDQDSFELIEGGTAGDAEIEPSPGHPQFALRRLIERLGVERYEIELLTPSAMSAREKLLSEAFRPVATTDRWRHRNEVIAGKTATEALGGVAVIEAADAREEALAIAITLREAREDKKATAALITPDRALARRVASELTRWGIKVDDSAGIPLGETEAGRFARLIATVAADRLAPVPLLALLRHTIAKFDVAASAVDALELTVLRGLRPAPGAEGLECAIVDGRKQELHRRDPRQRLGERDWDAALDLVRQVARALDPLLALCERDRVAFAELVAAHRAAIEDCGLALAGTARTETSNGSRELADAFDGFKDAAPDAPALSLADYAAVFSALLAGHSVRPAFEAGVAICILGPLEARLLHVDRMVIGGLNEGVWPPETHTDAWLNRPTRKMLGLDLPERIVGLRAHDFVQAMGASEVMLSRAKKQNGVETVASRFLQRLAAAAPDTAWQEARERGNRYLALGRTLEDRKKEPLLDQPAPRPPLAARPSQLSVTDIETLVRDPYSIYARYVLGLEPLDEIDADPGAAERGIILHKALAKFARAYPDKFPSDALDLMLAFGKEAFAGLRDFPGVAAIWWPRFGRVAHWFAAHEGGRWKEIKRTLAEIRGEITLDIAGRPFKLSARADRIDVRKDKSIAIIDYKTGQAPTLKEAISGLAPQLPLEAAIARSGGFESVRADTGISEIAALRLSGGNPAGELKTLDPSSAIRESKELAERFKIRNCDDLAAFAHKRFEQLIAYYADEKAPYLSIPRPKWRGRFGRYDHLARIKEWSAGEETDE